MEKPITSKLGSTTTDPASISRVSTFSNILKRITDKWTEGKQKEKKGKKKGTLMDCEFGFFGNYIVAGVAGAISSLVDGN
jgi:hypothetical protein